MRITKIALKDFRAFRGEYLIDLGKEGNNHLLYGENGSGKSSLFQAINLFLSTQKHEFILYKHFRVATDDGYVKLDVGDGINPDRTLEWGETSSPSEDALVIEVSKSKGFLDYKSILETYFLQQDKETINLFDLLVRNLLSNVENPISDLKLGEEITIIETTLKQSLIASKKENLENQIKLFNFGLGKILQDLETKINEILAIFEQNVSIKLTPKLIDYIQKPKTLTNCDICLDAFYYGEKREKHHHFLNEARLSAIAISIYLSALLIIPPSQMRILALDDVLIGLDMSNRMPLLNILNKFFSDWQIFIMTYDRSWYQIFFQRVNQNKWKRAEFYVRPTVDADEPIYYSKNDYLERAEQHLYNGDFRASVSYMRTAFEHMMKEFCDRKRYSVRYDIENKHTVIDFWNVIKGSEKKGKNNKKKKIVPAYLQKQLETYLKIILNPLSHDAYVNPFRKDVENTLEALKNLQAKLAES